MAEKQAQSAQSAWQRFLAWFTAPLWTPRCRHEWRYDEIESRGPWTGYIERCEKCGELRQIVQ